MPTLPRPTYGSTVTPRNPVNICRLSEELIPVRFRRINPAASLKRMLRLRRRRRTRLFPPDKSGGLIEASVTRGLTTVTFPPDKSGGLIEAVKGRPAGLFPPDKSGGLIEAILVEACFRRINPAASLKRRPPGSHVGAKRRPWFPPDKSGGLIEADASPRRRRRTRSCFRRINPAASLKRLAPDDGNDAATGRFRRINPAASLKR